MSVSLRSSAPYLKSLSIRSLLHQKWLDHADPWANFELVADLEELSRLNGWTYQEILPACLQECRGAFALKEDFLIWLDHGEKLLRQHRDYTRGAAFPRHWAAMLHSRFRYRMDSVFCCSVPDATVIREGGGVLSPEGRLLSEAAFIPGRLRKSELSPNGSKTLSGTYVSLLTMWGQKNISHFFFDAMLRTAALDDPGEFLYLVPQTLQSWHRGLCEIAGIREDQLVPVTSACMPVECLKIFHTSNSGCKPRRELLMTFRERALRNVSGNQNPERANRRLFIDRSRAKRRKLSNQKQIEPILKDYGFEIVRWEDYSMADQIRLASEAEVIAGPHGASLLNSLYCRPGAVLLEIFNPCWWDAITLRQSSLVGHQFWYCLGENASSDWDTLVNPSKLARVFDYMLGHQQFDYGAEEIHQ